MSSTQADYTALLSLALTAATAVVLLWHMRIIKWNNPPEPTPTIAMDQLREALRSAGIADLLRGPPTVPSPEELRYQALAEQFRNDPQGFLAAALEGKSIDDLPPEVQLILAQAISTLQAQTGLMELPQLPGEAEKHSLLVEGTGGHVIKGLSEGSNVTLTDSMGAIEISCVVNPTILTETAASADTSYSLLADAAELQLKRLKTDGNLSINDADGFLELSVPNQSLTEATSTDTNSHSLIGDAAGRKVKRIVKGTNVTITPTTDALQIGCDVNTTLTETAPIVPPDPASYSLLASATDRRLKRVRRGNNLNIADANGVLELSCADPSLTETPAPATPDPAAYSLVASAANRQLKRLRRGTNLNIDDTNGVLELSCVSPNQALTEAADPGSSYSIVSDAAGRKLKRIVKGSNVNITSTSDSLEISCTSASKALADAASTVTTTGLYSLVANGAENQLRRIAKGNNVIIDDAADPAVLKIGVPSFRTMQDITTTAVTLGPTHSNKFSVLRATSTATTITVTVYSGIEAGSEHEFLNLTGMSVTFAYSSPVIMTSVLGRTKLVVDGVALLKFVSNNQFILMGALET